MSTTSSTVEEEYVWSIVKRPECDTHLTDVLHFMRKPLRFDAQRVRTLSIRVRRRIIEHMSLPTVKFLREHDLFYEVYLKDLLPTTMNLLVLLVKMDRVTEASTRASACGISLEVVFALAEADMPEAVHAMLHKIRTVTLTERDIYACSSDMLEYIARNTKNMYDDTIARALMVNRFKNTKIVALLNLDNVYGLVRRARTYGRIYMATYFVEKGACFTSRDARHLVDLGYADVVLTHLDKCYGWTPRSLERLIRVTKITSKRYGMTHHPLEEALESMKLQFLL